MARRSEHLNVLLARAQKVEEVQTAVLAGLANTQQDQVVTKTFFGGHTPDDMAQHSECLEAFCGPGAPIKVPGYSRFCMKHPETGVTLTGVPDEMIRTEHGLWILDYKTARFTGNQDSLLPVYRGQLNGYAMIAEALGLGPVVGLGLIYYEPVTDIGVEQVDDVTLVNGFSMDFTAKVLPMEMDSGLVPALLVEAKDIFEVPEPSESREGCKDCGVVADVIRLAASGSRPLMGTVQK